MLASGITAIAGFAALVATDIRMLRDFGIVTVVDLARGAGRRAAGAARGPGLGRDGFAPQHLVRGNALAGALASAAGRAGERPMSGEERSSERAQSRRPGSRYSLFVGLAFLVADRGRTVNTLQQRGRRHPRDERRRRGGAAAGVRRAGAARRASTGDANISQDDCETSREPVPGRRAAHPGLRDRAAGARSASATCSTGRW